MTALLEVRDAAVAFGGLQALRGMSLDVTRGSITGLIGPNGAGKTTMFNCISGLQALDAGTITFDGDDVTGWPAHLRARRGMGRSFQHLGLMMQETVETNVLAAQHLGAGYGAGSILLRPRRWWQRERALAARVGEALDAFGLEAECHRVVEDLSFAAARFVELAAVLVEEPSLMLLDEPTTGLDVAEISRLGAVLEDVRAAGTSILVIAHDVQFVMDLCDHVYVLAQGTVLAAGVPDEVRQDQAVVDAYLGATA